MKILILANSSPGFFSTHYNEEAKFRNYSYDDLEKYRVDSHYHPADFYAYNLRLLGHDAKVANINDYYMQSAWARENSFKHSDREQYTLIWRKKVIPWIRKKSSRNWMYDILREQIRLYKPDIIYNTAVLVVAPTFLKEIKTYNSHIYIVGQHAPMTLDSAEDLSCYDLIISSYPPTIQWLNKNGIKNAFIKLGFEPYVQLGVSSFKKYDVTFVGAFHETHQARRDLVEGLCNYFDVHIWAPSLNADKTSPLWKNYHGLAYGREMYGVLASSRITLNHHGYKFPYANNLRLYDSTGMGTFLVTDYKENLSELFNLGKEVVAYKSLTDCVEFIQYFLSNSAERELIAKAGQKRTLKDHSYYQRMCEVSNILERMI